MLRPCIVAPRMRSSSEHARQTECAACCVIRVVRVRGCADMRACWDPDQHLHILFACRELSMSLLISRTRLTFMYSAGHKLCVKDYSASYARVQLMKQTLAPCHGWCCCGQHVLCHSAGAVLRNAFICGRAALGLRDLEIRGST